MLKKGFTLVELMVSIALIGLIAVCIFPAFTAGLNWTYGGGNKTKAIRNVQKALDTVYYKSESTTDSVSSIVGSLSVSGITNKTVTDRASTSPVDNRIYLGDGRYAAGSEVTITSTVNGKQESVTVFVPKNP